MNICENGITRPMNPEEIAVMRAQDIRERSRPLSADEVLAKIIPQTINAVTVDDNTALRMAGFYPGWASGVVYAVGCRVQRNGKLWKVMQAHTAQVGWEPENAASLWIQVCETHDGTEDDPIPYEGNMALEQGKHYNQDGHLYRCIRDTINPVYNRLEELVGVYVERVW